MIICKIWDADYPWDIRVEKVCRSLQQKHEVHLVCRNTKRRPTYEQLDGIFIHRLPALSTAFGQLNAAIGFPAFFNPLWLCTIWRTIRESRAELVLVRDLPLALTAIMVGRWFKIPVVIDLAENYPAMLQDRLRFTPTGLLGRLLRHPAPARLIEKLVLRFVDHVIVVVEESRDRLIEAGLRPNRITIVSNTPPLDRWTMEDHPEMPLDSPDGVNLVYLGNLGWSRGIETAIRAIRLLKDMRQRARLTIIGTGPNIDQFRSLAVHLGVTDCVDIMGRLPFYSVQSIMAESHVGLIPHYATNAWNATIPNKLFDYMAIGKPVIVSSARPTRRIVEETQCGMVFQDRDPGSLAETILAMSKRSVREDLGKRGKAAVHERFNWTVDEQRLLQAIELTIAARGNTQCAAS